MIKTFQNLYKSPLRRGEQKLYNKFVENMYYEYSIGLGLYLSQKLANKLGCYITITKLEKGTEAAVHFPKRNDFYTVAKK